MCCDPAATHDQSFFCSTSIKNGKYAICPSCFPVASLPVDTGCLQAAHMPRPILRSVLN